MDFPLHLPSQLREHLRALRKARGLTQAALGELVGVRQARIAEIEANPGAVSVDQLMKLLSALHVSLVLKQNVPDTIPAQQEASRRLPVNTPATGTWEMRPLTGVQRSVLASRTDAKSATDAQSLRDANPHADVIPTSTRDFVIRPKKGSW